MSPKQILVILQKRLLTIVVTLVAMVAGAGIFVLVVPQRYDAQATATIDIAQADPITGNAIGVTGARYIQGNMMLLVKSQRVAVDVVRRLNLASDSGMAARYRNSGAFGQTDIVQWIAAELVRNVDARFTDGTNVLTITYKWSDGALAARVANAFMSAFMNAAIEMKVAGAQQTVQWFEPQTQKLRAEVEEIREKINEYQRTARLAPTNFGDAEVNLLNQLTVDLVNNRAEALKIESLLNEAKRAKPAEVNAQPFDSPLLQSLRSSLATNVAEISKAQAELGLRNPRVVTLEAAQRSLQTQIAAEIENARANLEAKLASTLVQIAALEKTRVVQVDKLIELQNQRDKLSQLTLELQVKQDRLNQAARTAASAQLQGQLSFSNISVLDAASAPAGPAFPKPRTILPLSVLAGLGLGLILAMLHEALDRRIRSPQDMGFATNVPSFGELISSNPIHTALFRRMLEIAAPAGRKRHAAATPAVR